MTPSPGQLLGIGSTTHFNLGVGRPGGHVDYGERELAGDLTMPEFRVTDYGVAFRVGVDGKTTSKNTKYPRTELRELERDGLTRAAWDGARDGHYMVFVLRVLKVPKNKPWVCVAQIHDAESDLIRLQTEGDSPERLRLVARNTPPGEDDEQVRTVLPAYTLGQEISGRLEVYDGLGRLHLNGALVLEFPAKAKGCYFKAGAYLQSNTSFDKPGEVAEVEFRAGGFAHWHTGWPVPILGTGPAPVEPDDGSPMTTPAPDQLDALVGRVDEIDRRVSALENAQPDEGPQPDEPPSDSRLYTIQPGDTLSGIAARQGLSWTQLYAVNKQAIGDDPSRILPGTVITIPTGGQPPQSPPVEQPPVEQPPVEQPPVEQPPAQGSRGIRRPLPAPASPTARLGPDGDLQATLDALKPGQTLFLTGDFGDADVDLKRSGSPASPVRVVSDGSAVIKGLDITANHVEVVGINIVRGDGGSLSVKGNNILIEDVLVDSPGDGKNGDCCRFWGSDLVFRNCTFRNTDNSNGHADGMQNYSTSTSFPRTGNVLIERCSFEKIDNICVIMEGPNSSYGDGDGKGQTSGVTIRDCYLEADSAQAIWFDDIKNWRVENCTFGATEEHTVHHAIGVTNDSTGGVVQGCEFSERIKCQVGMDNSSRSGYVGPEPKCAP